MNEYEHTIEEYIAEVAWLTHKLADTRAQLGRSRRHWDVMSNEARRAAVLAARKLDAALLLIHDLWYEQERWTGPTASSHIRSDMADRVRALVPLRVTKGIE